MEKKKSRSFPGNRYLVTNYILVNTVIYLGRPSTYHNCTRVSYKHLYSIFREKDSFLYTSSTNKPVIGEAGQDDYENKVLFFCLRMPYKGGGYTNVNRKRESHHKIFDKTIDHAAGG